MTEIKCRLDKLLTDLEKGPITQTEINRRFPNGEFRQIRRRIVHVETFPETYLCIFPEVKGNYLPLVISDRAENYFQEAEKFHRNWMGVFQSVLDLPIKENSHESIRRKLNDLFNSHLDGMKYDITLIQGFNELPLQRQEYHRNHFLGRIKGELSVKDEKFMKQVEFSHLLEETRT